MIAIVIPAYNEEKNIEWIVRECKKYGSVIVVDDNSRDKTPELAKHAGASVIRHPVNRGLGAALRSGFEKAIEMNSDIVITIDADGQHNPKDIPRFVETLNNGYDFVLGRRDLRKYPLRKKFLSRKKYPPRRKKLQSGIMKPWPRRTLVGNRLARWR